MLSCCPDMHLLWTRAQGLHRALSCLQPSPQCVRMHGAQLQLLNSFSCYVQMLAKRQLLSPPCMPPNTIGSPVGREEAKENALHLQVVQIYLQTYHVWMQNFSAIECHCAA